MSLFPRIIRPRGLQPPWNEQREIGIGYASVIIGDWCSSAAMSYLAPTISDFWNYQHSAESTQNIVTPAKWSAFKWKQVRNFSLLIFWPLESSSELPILNIVHRSIIISMPRYYEANKLVPVEATCIVAYRRSSITSLSWYCACPMASQRP